MFETIWEGIKSVFVGGVKILVGAAKAAWTVIKYALKSAVWIITGMFTIAGHLASYAIKTLSKLFTPQKIIFIPKKKIPALVDFLNDQATKDGIIEDLEPIDISSQLSEAASKGQAMIYAVGEDNEGEVAVSDPEFVSASSWDEKIEDANRNNQIYVKKIRVAN